MAAHGYLIFLIRANLPHRTRELQLLDALGESRSDAFDEVLSVLGEIGSGYHPIPKRAEGFRFIECIVGGRSLFMRFRRGPQGGPGETYDMDQKKSSETSERIALLSELRASFYFPPGSYYGFLFVERNGGRHIKDLVQRHVVKPVMTRNRVMIQLDAYAESSDWERELQDKQILRVTEVLKPKDSSHDASTMDDTLVKISTEGYGLAKFTKDILSAVTGITKRRDKRYELLAEAAPLERANRLWNQEDKNVRKAARQGKAVTGFTVADAAELDRLKQELKELNEPVEAAQLAHDLQERVPVDRDDLESQRLEVAWGSTKPERSFVVEGDHVPQLVYEFSDTRLTDTQLRAAWDEHATKILTGLGVTLPADWVHNKPKE